MAKTSLPRTNRPRQRSGDQSPPQASAQMIWVPPMGVSVAGGPDAGAVSVFERGVALLQQHNYRAALVQFERLEGGFPGERALLDRVRVYATLCRRELGRPAARTPETVEERLTAATAALNDGDDRRAERLAVQALDEAPGHDLGHYLLAVVHARRGATRAALDALRHAIDMNPEVRVQARYDDDFEPLRGHDAFERMVSETPAQSGTRRSS